MDDTGHVKGRRGSTVLELVVAAFIAITLLTLSLQYVATSIQVRRASRQRAVALQTAYNVLEICSSWPLRALTDDRLAELARSHAADTTLPQGRVQITLSESVEPPGKQIGIEITWQGRNGQPVAPVRLSTWRYKIQ